MVVDAAATRCKFNNFGTGVTRAILGLDVCISRKQAQNVSIGGRGCFLIIGGGALCHSPECLSGYGKTVRT